MGYKSILIFALIALVSLASACDKKSEPSPAKDRATPSARSAANKEPAHACTGGRPGSHEDWCVGHQVPESLCTRCNSSLIPAFKATGDWCEEHGLPESQCLICNPDLKIERPPRADEASR